MRPEPYLKVFFFERNNEDPLGTDEQWQSQVDNDQFSFLLRDIGDKEKQKQVLVALAEAYPTEAYFLGQLGRFLYEKANDESEFDEADRYIAEALTPDDGENDFNLQHIGGMSARRRLEWLKRRYTKDETDSVTISRIIQLGDLANLYFNRSRSINPYNFHAYVAQIRTLATCIDFGKQIKGEEDAMLFVVDSANRWFLEQYTTIKSLIDQAKGIIEQQETLGVTTKLARAKSFIKSSEEYYYSAMGDYGASAEIFRKLSDTADRSYRPAMRRMFVESVLLSKVRGDKSKIDLAWARLKADERKLVEDSINKDILQNAGNIYALRRWFQMVRYSGIEVPIEEIISRLNILFQHSDDTRIFKLESAFYLYILHTLLAIKAGKAGRFTQWQLMIISK